MEFYKPYTYVKRGRVWFDTIWHIHFEDAPIYLEKFIWPFNIVWTKLVVGWLNGAYNLGYQQALNDIQNSNEGDKNGRE